MRGVHEDQVMDDRYVFLDLAATSVESDDMVHRDEAFYSDFVK